MSLLVPSSAALSFLTNMTEKSKSTSPGAVEVEICVIRQLIDIKCKVRLTHSNICTVCGKDKVTAVCVVACCRPERVPGS